MFEFLKKLFGGGPSVDLAALIQGGAYLVDVRSKAEFSAGHVKGSVNIPLDTLASNLSKFKGKENIIVFCRSGNRSSMAKALLEQNGFNNVVNGGSWHNVNQYVG